MLATSAGRHLLQSLVAPFAADGIRRRARAGSGTSGVRASVLPRLDDLLGPLSREALPGIFAFASVAFDPSRCGAVTIVAAHQIADEPARLGGPHDEPPRYRGQALAGR